MPEEDGRARLGAQGRVPRLAPRSTRLLSLLLRARGAPGVQQAKMSAAELRPRLRGPVPESGAHSPLALGRLAPYKVPSGNDRSASRAPTLASPSMRQWLAGQAEGSASGSDSTCPSAIAVNNEQSATSTSHLERGTGGGHDEQVGSEPSEPRDDVTAFPLCESQEATGGTEAILQEHAQPDETRREKLEAAKEECSRILAAYLESLVAATERSPTAVKGKPDWPTGPTTSWNSAHCAQYESTLLTLLAQGHLPDAEMSSAQRDVLGSEQQSQFEPQRTAPGAEHAPPPLGLSGPSASGLSASTSVAGDAAGGQHESGGRERCMRTGCPNPAAESRDWDNEYCSCECLVAHCRDVFKGCSDNLVQ